MAQTGRLHQHGMAVRRHGNGIAKAQQRHTVQAGMQEGRSYCRTAKERNGPSYAACFYAIKQCAVVLCLTNK